MAHFGCTDEEAAERLRRSIQNLFNELEVPDHPPIPQQDPLPDYPDPLLECQNPPDHQMEEDADPPPKKKPIFVNFDLDGPIASCVPQSPSELSGTLYPSALNVFEDSSRSNQCHWSLPIG